MVHEQRHTFRIDFISCSCDAIVTIDSHQFCSTVRPLGTCAGVRRKLGTNRRPAGRERAGPEARAAMVMPRETLLGARPRGIAPAATPWRAVSRDRPSIAETVGSTGGTALNKKRLRCCNSLMNLQTTRSCDRSSVQCGDAMGIEHIRPGCKPGVAMTKSPAC